MIQCHIGANRAQVSVVLWCLLFFWPYLLIRVSYLFDVMMAIYATLSSKGNQPPPTLSPFPHSPRPLCLSSPLPLFPFSRCSNNNQHLLRLTWVTKGARSVPASHRTAPSPKGRVTFRCAKCAILSTQNML